MHNQMNKTIDAYLWDQDASQSRSASVVCVPPLKEYEGPARTKGRDRKADGDGRSGAG